MGKQKELAKNTGIIGIGKLSSQLVSFLLLPLYTSILSAAEYGIVDLLLSYIQLLLPIVSVQLDQALFRFLVSKRSDGEECSTIISTMGFFSVIQIVLYGTLFVVVQFFIDYDFKWFFLLNISCFVFSSFAAGCARGLGNNVSFSIQSFIAVLTNILFNIVFLVLLRMGAGGMLLASALSALVAGIYGFWSNKIFSYLSLSAIDKSRMREFYSYSVPLIPNQLSWWVMKASDKTVINVFVSTAANGIIAVAAKFSSAYIMIYNLFNLAWTESVVVHIHDEDAEEYLKETINSMFSLFASLCFGIIAVMPFVFGILVPNQEYSEAFYLIPIYMISVLFNAVVGLYSAIYVVNKDTKAIAMTSGIAAVVNLLANLAMVKIIGVYAAPVSSALGFAVIMVYRYFHSRKYIDIRIKTSVSLSALIVGGIVISLYYLNNFTLYICSVCLCILYAIVLNKKLVRSILLLKKR